MFVKITNMTTTTVTKYFEIQYYIKQMKILEIFDIFSFLCTQMNLYYIAKEILNLYNFKSVLIVYSS